MSGLWVSLLEEVDTLATDTGPGGRWIGGLIVLFLAYIGYAFTAPIIDTYLPDAAENTQGYNQYTGTIITNTQNNYWLAVVVLMVGGLGYLFISGLPGRTEEQWERYI